MLTNAKRNKERKSDLFLSPKFLTIVHRPAGKGFLSNGGRRFSDPSYFDSEPGAKSS